MHTLWCDEIDHVNTNHRASQSPHIAHWASSARFISDIRFIHPCEISSPSLLRPAPGRSSSVTCHQNVLVLCKTQVSHLARFPFHVFLLNTLSCVKAQLDEHCKPMTCHLTVSHIIPGLISPNGWHALSVWWQTVFTFHVQLNAVGFDIM